MRPLGELDLANELRLDPDDVASADLGHLRHFAERRRSALQRTELVEKLVDLPAVEAGADVAGIHELAALVVAEHEGAEARRTPSRAFREAGDDELLLAVCLDLQPVAGAPALRVLGVEPFGHDPFEPLFLCGL